MTLRQRLFVSGLAVGVPLAVALFFGAEWFRLREMDGSLSQYVARENTSDARERCEASPAGFGQSRPMGPGGPRGRGPDGRRGFPPDGPPPDGGRRGPRGGDHDGPPGGPGGRPSPPRGGIGAPFEMFVYNAAFEPADPNAPQLSADSRALLQSSATAASRYPTTDGTGAQLAVWTPWGEGPCAVLMGRLRPRPGEVREQSVGLLLVVITVVLAVWVAAGPVISRMRRLADAVRRSAASRYEVPVPSDGRGELADLATAFNEAGATVRRHLESIESREEALRQFVANTTHDVAVPLTVLQGHLDTLDRTLAGTAAHDAVRASIQEAHYMASLLRNLGAATKLDAASAPLDLRPVDLNALIERVVMRHRPVARALDVDLNDAVPEDTVTAVSDLTLIEQAVGNLVDNALRYNRPGGHVAVVLDRTAGERFTIRVRDDGPGIAAADLARITERRFRGGDARTRRADGQGLGLAIVAEAAARLDLSLEFETPPEGGLVASVSGRTDPRMA